MALPRALARYPEAISRKGLTIYDPIEVGDNELWIPSPELEAILEQRVVGLELGGLPLRTRSKVVKSAVCAALGYPVPESFRKTKPRFPGQCFDTYTQKANNLQVWNEELSPTRRYVLLRVSEDDIVRRVRVVTGDTLSLLDTTGTLTQKYQARVPAGDASELVTVMDTDNVVAMGLVSGTHGKLAGLPTDQPVEGGLLGVADVFGRLMRVVGTTFEDTGVDQERNRGAGLHRLACEALGFQAYKDDGQFPDIRHQLVEVKLQTSPTIDLGLVTPDSRHPIDSPKVRNRQIRHCDVRYAVFSGATDGKRVTVTRLIVSTGEQFFERFTRFGGKVLNKKLQIRLPDTFFE